MVAKALRLSKTSLAVVSGEGTRNKVLHIAGADPKALAGLVRERLAVGADVNAQRD